MRALRLVRNLGPIIDAAAPVARVHGDPKSSVPAPRAEVDVYRRFYAYDKTPLNARVDSVDDSSPFWRKERISVDAPYGRERVIVVDLAWHPQVHDESSCVGRVLELVDRNLPAALIA